MIDIGKIEREILKYCLDGPVELMPLIGNSEEPQSAYYRKSKKLRKHGYLIKIENGFKTTTMGKSALEDSLVNFDWDILEKYIPHLKLIPMKTHRDIVELILAAIIARRDQVRKDHHPTFVLFGPTATFKTWIARVVCTMLGLPCEKHIIPMMGESGRSIFIRKTSQGNIGTKRDFLDSLVVCFDELHTVKKSVLDLCLTYLQGGIDIDVENESMRLCPVPMATYNPKNGEDIGERIKFEPQNLRRSVLCDFKNVAIPREFRDQGAPTLDKLKKLKIITLPKHQSNCEEYRTMITDFIDTCVKEDCGQVFDTDMLLLLCAGMTAYLPENQAVVLVLERYLSVTETAGFLRDDWRSKMDGFMRNILNRKKIEITKNSSQPRYSKNITREDNFNWGIHLAPKDT